MASFDPKVPYNQLAGLPPRLEVETKAVLRKCISARAAIAALKEAGQLVPNQSVLINTIPLFEAKDSSEIENIVTTTDNLFKYVDTDQSSADQSTKEALRYRTALREGFEAIQERPLCTTTVEKICTTIKGREMKIRKTSGTALANSKGKIVYTPPEGEQTLRDKLANWEQFLFNNTEFDPLVCMAIGHYQFEAIHPFSDGNGRTGRILNILYLLQTGLLSIPVLFLSRYSIQNKSEYYESLLNVTKDSNWEDWILYMLSAVEETAVWTTQKIHQIKNEMDACVLLVKDQLPKIYTRELVEILFTQPYCRISNLVEEGIAQRQTASEYLKELSKIGLLDEHVLGREKVFINKRLMEIFLSD